MVAFAIFGSRRVTLFFEERASAPGVQDGKGLQLLLSLGPRASCYLPISWITSAETRWERRKRQAHVGGRTTGQWTRSRFRPSSRFRPPPSHLHRVFSPSARGSIRFFPGYRNTVLTVLLFSRDTPCPVLFIANRALLRYYPIRFAHLITATWTLLRQLISVLMFLIGRISSRLYRVHYRDKYTRHIWHRDSANDSIDTKLTEWLTDRNVQLAQVRDDVYVLGRRERWHLCDWQ